MRVRTVTEELAVVSQDERRFASLPHRHAQAQLIYAISGVVVVTTTRGTWVVPPSRAVWVPADTEHQTRSHAEVRFRALLIATADHPGLPTGCAVVEVTPLLRELILRLAELAELGGQAADSPITRAVTHLLLLELAFLPVQPLALPLPAHPALARLCARLRDDPSSSASLEAVAARLHTSRASFMRLFRRETGMSFGRWCQQARLLRSLSLLAGGEPVLSVALECGYDSPSAFSAMFRRSLGRSPSEYFAPAPLGHDRNGGDPGGLGRRPGVFNAHGASAGSVHT